MHISGFPTRNEILTDPPSNMNDEPVREIAQLKLNIALDTGLLQWCARFLKINFFALFLFLFIQADSRVVNALSISASDPGFYTQ